MYIRSKWNINEFCVHSRLGSHPPKSFIMHMHVFRNMEKTHICFWSEAHWLKDAQPLLSEDHFIKVNVVGQSTLGVAQNMKDHFKICTQSMQFSFHFCRNNITFFIKNYFYSTLSPNHVLIRESGMKTKPYFFLSSS